MTVNLSPPLTPYSYRSAFTGSASAALECKRVGVEEGLRKGPQTIEKAKQGAYVARSVSSLQKIRMNDGAVYGVLHLDSGDLRCEPYEDFLRSVVASDESSLLRDFILTVGIVSIHWFNVISPADRSISELKRELKLLASKNWKEILT